MALWLVPLRQLADKNLLVTRSRGNDRGFRGMKGHGIDATGMSRQIVQFLRTHYIPNVHPVIAAARRHHASIRRPAAFQQSLFRTVPVSRKCLGVSFLARSNTTNIGSNVPGTQRLIHAVAENVCGIRMHGQTGDRIRVPRYAVDGRGGPTDIPRMNLGINASRKDELRIPFRRR